jgi:hypothetical protein
MFHSREARKFGILHMDFLLIFLFAIPRILMPITTKVRKHGSKNAGEFRTPYDQCLQIILNVTRGSCFNNLIYQPLYSMVAK